MDPSIESEIRNHAWNYFSLHAQQRMNAFQFFITLEIALFGSVLLVLQFAKSHTAWFSVFGIIITLLAFVFWKIDQRTKDLIKAAENSLIQIESYFLSNSAVVTALPFSSDPQRSGAMMTFPLLGGRMSYSKCFGLIFFFSAFLGIVIFGWLLSSPSVA